MFVLWNILGSYKRTFKNRIFYFHRRIGYTQQALE